jgi:hypothetical protein
MYRVKVVLPTTVTTVRVNTEGSPHEAAEKALAYLKEEGLVQGLDNYVKLIIENVETGEVVDSTRDDMSTASGLRSDGGRDLKTIAEELAAKLAATDSTDTTPVFQLDEHEAVNLEGEEFYEPGPDEDTVTRE